MNMTATYSPDDNKLRLYAGGRLSPELYARVKAEGFRWAPKQELFFAPTWTPGAEDLLLELCGEIGDEDTSLADRAEERAERFDGYSENRQQDAEQARAGVARIADGIPLGQPILIGHHSEKHARRDAEKIQNGMRRAVKMWETSKYWTERAAGAIRHAKYKERPDVRARRIKTIEAARRKMERTRTESQEFLILWSAEGLTWERARAISNHDHISKSFPLAEYPRAAPASQYEGPMGLWSALEGIITAEQARELATAAHRRTVARADRWITHYDNRLAYERAMLADAGGTVADKTGPEKGGACRCWASVRGGWSYIQKVNRVSITLLDNWGNGGRSFTRVIPFDKLVAIMTRAEVEAARAAGLLFDTTDKTGFILREKPTDEVKEETSDERRDRQHKEHLAAVAAHDAENAEAKLRRQWAAAGVSEDRQAQLLAEIAAKAAPYAKVGPFTLQGGDAGSEDFERMRESLRQGVQVVSAPQLFPTPPNLAARMVELAGIEEGHRVLEPSAGTGAIVQAINGSGCVLNVCEINNGLCRRLNTMPNINRVFEGDFLELNGELGAFDRVLMNPPFQDGDDIKHIMHALQMLKPGGRLVAICANGPRQQAKLRPLATEWEDLPAGTFKQSGTGVNTALLVVDKAAA